MFYFRVFEPSMCFILGFANTKPDFRTEIKCFILGLSCILMHVMRLFHELSVL